MMNMFTQESQTQISDYLKILGAPFRIHILYNIGYGEACVCHLEATLKKRQAYISQHLMVMRDAGILESRREGKYIFYRVSDNRIFDLFESTARILGLPVCNESELSHSSKQKKCACPSCE